MKIQPNEDGTCSRECEQCSSTARSHNPWTDEMAYCSELHQFIVLGHPCPPLHAAMARVVEVAFREYKKGHVWKDLADKLDALRELTGEK